MVADGSTVKIHYTLRIDGEVIDTSAGAEPLSYVQGEGEIVPGLEEELEGLRPGDKRRITVAPEAGYGTRNPKAVEKFPRTSFGHIDRLKVGAVVAGKQGERRFKAVITAFDDQHITVDMNHPLAGKTLDFEVEVVAVHPPSPDDRQVARR